MTSTFEKIKDQLGLRLKILTNDNPLGLAERVKTSFSRYPGKKAQSYLLQRHVKNEKSPYFEIEVSDFVLDSSITKREYTKDYYGRKISVPLISLDTFIAQQGIKKLDFVKMDIEGAEELAFRGFDQNLKKLRSKWSVSSYHIDFENEPQHEKLLKILKHYGYQVSEKRKAHIYAW